MPIRPENKARYPKNWKSEIVPRIRLRSDNRCECMGHCGKDHQSEWPNSKRCYRMNGMPIDDITGPRVVLTVAHLDHAPENCSDENLLHMCQGCHNRYDLPIRRANRRARLRAEQEIDQGVLFCDDVCRAV